MIRHNIQTYKSITAVTFSKPRIHQAMSTMHSEVREIHSNDTIGQYKKYNTSIYKMHHDIIQIFTKYIGY